MQGRLARAAGSTLAFDAAPETASSIVGAVREDGARRPRVVIVGGGFAGLAAAKALRGADLDVMLLDRTNHYLFQPLLYQVATAALAPSDITSPLRWLLRDQENATVLLAEATAIDVDRRVIVTHAAAGEVSYDHLIVATGARHAYFGNDDWERWAPGLKSVDDAREIRRRWLTAFERAELATTPEERARWLTFVIIGGGPTGVELAGVLPEIAHRAMRRNFRHIDPRDARIILIEGGPRVLPTYPERLSERARRDLEELGVEVRLEQRVTHVDGDAVHVGDARIPTHTVFWAAGNQASPLAATLGAALDRAGRVLVEPDLSISGHPEVFVVGDLAAARQADGRIVPGVAPAANQMGAAAARNIVRTLRGEARRPFVYRDKGSLATIGRYRAIASVGRLRLTGVLAWWFWLFIHLLYLAGFRNRLNVLIEWGYAYFTDQRGARLLTDHDAR